MICKKDSLTGKMYIMVYKLYCQYFTTIIYITRLYFKFTYSMAILTVYSNVALCKR